MVYFRRRRSVGGVSSASVVDLTVRRAAAPLELVDLTMNTDEDSDSGSEYFHVSKLSLSPKTFSSGFVRDVPLLKPKQSRVLK